ncbi:MAG: ISLre2 family transposase [Liquorilactobacillus nagelii]|uniref:ISLre2 family transposase n=1 Tax=Liquorilactobacillus nagelii TaxID=82688 RepID=UPI0039E7B74A
MASAVNLLTPISMSHQKVAGVIKEAGARIDNYQRQQGINDTVEKNKPMILYLEGDAFSVKQQAFHHNRQIRNLFVHRFQIYEGIRKNGKRRELINRHIISSLDRQQAMKEVSEYLQAHYDLKKTIIISGSDNGSGYEAEVFKELAPDCLKQEHFLDQYHLNRKLQERLSFDFELIKPMKKAVYSWNWDQVRVILDTAESRITKEDQAGQEKRMALRKLENYLKRNWQYIKPAKLRGVKKPNGLGSCESNHRRYTYRLKRQGRSWSKAGLKAMLRIIDAQQNEGLVEAMRFKELAKRFTHQVKDKLSSFKLFEKVQAPHIGVLQGRIVQDAPSSSAIGRLAKIF